MIRQITSGEFVGTGIEAIDEKTRTLYFNAAGREAGEDPYFTHFYSVNIDTSATSSCSIPATRRTRSAMNDKNTFFVDNSSRIDIGARVRALRRGGQQGDGPREDGRRPR